MFFAEYIQILHKHISLGVNRHCFTEEFLCHASTKLQEGDYSDSSYKNYFKGVTEGKGKHAPVIGDRIGKFAFDNLQSINNCSLDKYLSNLIEKAKAESELRIAFQKHFAQLPPDTGGDDANESIKDNNGKIISKGIVQLAKQTRRLFVVTINDVIFTYSHTKKNHSSSSHDEPAASQDETASLQVEEAERSFDSGPKTGSVRMLETDRTEIASIIDRLTKILDRMFVIAITADLSQLEHSTELVDFLRSATVNYMSSESLEKFATYNESHVLQFHPCELASRKVNRAKSKASDNKASDNKASDNKASDNNASDSNASDSRDIPNTAKAIENDVPIDQVFQCSKEVIDKNMPEWLKAIAQNLEELLSENQKLSLFCTRYPQYEALTKLYKKAFTLWPKMFCRDLANDIEKPYSKDVNEYKELLESCSQSIVLNNPFVQNTP